MSNVKTYIKNGTRIKCNEVYARLNIGRHTGYYLDNEDYIFSQDFGCFSTGHYQILIDDQRLPYVLIPEDQFDQLTQEDLDDISKVIKGGN